MLTISNQIRELKPDSWYNFKPEDTSIVFDKNKRYGVDEDNSYIFNSVTPNYLVPRWNKPVESFTGVDEDYTSNQLAESEFLMENDASLMCGRNKSKMAGLLLGGKGKDVTFILKLKDGRKMLATTDSKTFTKIAAMAF